MHLRTAARWARVAQGGFPRLGGGIRGFAISRKRIDKTINVVLLEVRESVSFYSRNPRNWVEGWDVVTWLFGGGEALLFYFNISDGMDGTYVRSKLGLDLRGSLSISRE
eukprot:1371673-Amorphochlora_amoeboformis.AAC.1